jgi:hypothetical protein
MFMGYTIRQVSFEAAIFFSVQCKLFILEGMQGLYPVYTKLLLGSVLFP